MTESGGAPVDLKKGAGTGPKPKKRTAQLIDRLPPHSVEAELAVLACILLAPHEVMGLCIEKFKARGEVFYDLRHRTVYEMLEIMYEAKQAIDLITLAQALKDKQQLEGVGGLEFLAPLPDRVPSAANAAYYMDIVWDKYLLRRMIHTCTDIVAQVYDHEGEVDALLDEVETQILRIGEERVEGEDKSIKTLVDTAITQIEKFHTNQGMLSGLSTGFADLDKMTSGLHEGEMIVIAARPSMGKTSLAMNMVEAVCVDQKQPVGVFSLEMSAESLVLRMMCSRARVNLRSIREGFLAERDFPKLTGAAGKLASAKLLIDDTSGLSIMQLRAKARRMWQQHGIKLFVIDYLQLLQSTTRRSENRQQEIAEISRGVKSLAKELKVPVIVLSQLNRDMEKEKGRAPRLSDLRESGSIEQDADLVGLLYQPKSGDDEDGSDLKNDVRPVKLLIAKQRNGPTGDVDLTFMRSYTRFESAAKISPEDQPG